VRARRRAAAPPRGLPTRPRTPTDAQHPLAAAAADVQAGDQDDAQPRQVGRRASWPHVHPPPAAAERPARACAQVAASLQLDTITAQVLAQPGLTIIMGAPPCSAPARWARPWLPQQAGPAWRAPCTSIAATSIIVRAPLCRPDRRARAGPGHPVWHPSRQHLPLQRG
jgi:hypothetical protein